MGTDRPQSLNRPTPLMVKTDRSGLPRALQLRRTWRNVRTVLDRWKLDDGWWRATPISRLYFRVELEDGRVVVVYRDLLSREQWWTQRD